jgi:hypothetical protein
MIYRFHYMALADNRQRYLPLPDDRLAPRGQPLAYPEAVLLVNPVEPELKGEVPRISSLTRNSSTTLYIYIYIYIYMPRQFLGVISIFGSQYLKVTLHEFS